MAVKASIAAAVAFLSIPASGQGVYPDFVLEETGVTSASGSYQINGAATDLGTDWCDILDPATLYDCSSSLTKPDGAATLDSQSSFSLGPFTASDDVAGTTILQHLGMANASVTFTCMNAGYGSCVPVGYSRANSEADYQFTLTAIDALVFDFEATVTANGGASTRVQVEKNGIVVKDVLFNVDGFEPGFEIALLPGENLAYRITAASIESTNRGTMAQSASFDSRIMIPEPSQPGAALAVVAALLALRLLAGAAAGWPQARSAKILSPENGRAVGRKQHATH